VPAALLLPLLLATDGGVSLETYRASQQALETRRAALSREFRKTPAKRPALRQQARAAILTHLDDVAFPAWAGTPWDFYGTTTTPREGTIACGYFVTTVLEQAGYHLERVTLAQQASMYLVRSVARGSKVVSLREETPAQALADVRRDFGDGLYVVGLDLHTGFLRLDGKRAAFCHSSYLEPAVVTCEDPLTAGAFASRLYVVGSALNDAVLDDWILGRKVPSVLPRHPRRF